MAEDNEEQTLEIGGEIVGGLFRAEIDTSAPFESVKDAVNKFGGLGFWKPTNKSSPSSLLPCEWEDVDVEKVEEQAAELEAELRLKERETLEVLKELEATKLMVEELKSKLRKEEMAVELNVSPDLSVEKLSRVIQVEDKENDPNLSLQKMPDNSNLVMSSSTTDTILMELKQAKLNLNKTTSDLAEIRASVELYNRKIEKERASLEKTRERLRSNTNKISSLEEEISQTRSKLHEGDDVAAELQRLNTKAEEYKQVGEAAKSEVMKVVSQIELTKAKIKTAEIRLVAAQKIKEAAKAAEAVALAEIKALERSEDASSGILEESSGNITLTVEEYSSLRNKAREAEECSNMKVLEAMLQVDEANMSKDDIIKQVEQAMEEVKTSKKGLEDALNRVESANNAKLAVEEALRKWRSENGERRRSVQNSTKFKNPYPSTRRRDSWMLDLNGVNLLGEATTPVLKPNLSIGQILSRKLLITEEFESRKSSAKRKISLAQMLGKKNGEMSSAWKLEESRNLVKLPAKRKKFGFARFSVLLPKHSQKKKKSSLSSPNARFNFLASGCKGELKEVDHLAHLKI